MHQVDELRDALKREFPDYADRTGDWGGVLARRPPARRRRSPLIALAALAFVVAAVLLWPGDDSSPPVLERALAVATDGPVVHLVLGSEDARMTEIDLETGARRRLQGRHEQWFDPDRGFHDQYSVDGRVKQDILYPAGSLPEVERQFLALDEYREALESERASVSGKRKVNGHDVYWLRFHVRYPSFGIPHYDADHEVAVDAETFEPRLWRTFPTKKSLSGYEPTEVEIELWETLPAGSGDFTAATEGNALVEGWSGVARIGPRTPANARSVLSPPALWLGNRFEGLKLAAMYEISAERGKGASFKKVPALEVCYGALLNDTSCAAPYPPARSPHVSFTQANTPQSWFGWDQVVVPVEGTLIVIEQHPEFAQGFIQKDGVYAAINATSEELLVAAARELRPIP